MTPTKKPKAKTKASPRRKRRKPAAKQAVKVVVTKAKPSPRKRPPPTEPAPEVAKLKPLPRPRTKQRVRSPAEALGARAKAQIARDYRETWDTGAGRRTLSDLFLWGGVFSQIDTKDPIAMATRVGERNLALRIAEMLGFSAEDFAPMAIETTDLGNELMGTFKGEQSYGQH